MENAKVCANISNLLQTLVDIFMFEGDGCPMSILKSSNLLSKERSLLV